MSGHISPRSTYFGIFGGLMILTVITVSVAFVNLGALNFPVAIAIAILKATLVILFFMHVKYSSRLTKLIVSGAFFFLLILLALTLTDYMSRGWHVGRVGTAAAGTSQGTAADPVPRPVGQPLREGGEPGAATPPPAGER